MTVDVTALDTGLYRQNGFRLLGLPTDGSLKRAKRAAGNLRRQIEEGGGNAPGSAIGRFAPPADAPGLNAAVHRLEDPSARLLDEIFWFRFDGAADPTLARLRDQGAAGVARVVEDWEADEADGDAAERHRATHNLAIFHHLLAIELEERHEDELKRAPAGGRHADALQRLRTEADACWRAALLRWRHLLADQGFWQWVRERGQAIGAGRLEKAELDRFEKELAAGLLRVSAGLMQRAAEQRRQDDIDRLRRLITDAGFAASALDDVLERRLEPTIARLHKRIESVKDELETDNAGAGRLALKLHTELEPRLTLLDRLLAADHPTLRDLHESLAQTVNRAQVICFGEAQDYQLCAKLLELARPHARSKELKETIDANRNAVRCFFCGKDVIAKGSEYVVTMFQITSFMPATGNVRYSQQKLKLPRCKACGRKWGQPAKLRDHPFVEEELANGWQIGSEPSSSDVEAFVLRHRRW